MLYAEEILDISSAPPYLQITTSGHYLWEGELHDAVGEHLNEYLSVEGNADETERCQLVVNSISMKINFDTSIKSEIKKKITINIS